MLAQKTPPRAIPMPKRRGNYTAPPVLRAISVLRHIGQGNRCANSSRAAKELNINRTTLIRILATLEAERFIERLPEGGFRLGASVMALGAEAQYEIALVQTARPILRRLAEELGLSAHIGVRDDSEIVYLARETPDQAAAGAVREGLRLPAHATAIGHVLLADLDADGLRKIYDGQPLAAYTEATPTSLAALTSQLDAERDAGPAISVAQFHPEMGSAAAPVKDALGRTIAAINVTGPADRFAPTSSARDGILQKLAAAAQELTEALAQTPEG